MYIKEIDICNKFQQAEDRISKKNMDKEYAPIAGSPEFSKLSIQLALGDNNPVLKEGLVRFL